MKKVNILNHLEVIGEGEYEVYIDDKLSIGEAIDEAVRTDVYWSGKDDCYYIDIAIEVLGADFIEEGALRAARAGYTIETERKYREHIEEWTENLDFEDLEEEIKEEIIKDIAENDFELKIIKSARKNDYSEYHRLIRDFTYIELYD
jgi:hypothetical protein